MKISFSNAQIDKAMHALASIPNGANRAMANAINRAVKGIRTDLSRAVKDQYAINAGDVSKTIQVKLASPARLSAAAISVGSPIPLIKFKVNPKSPKRVPVLRAGVKRGGTKPIRGAFTATVRGSYTGVFIRKGGSRLPIKQLYAPSIPQLIGNDVVKQLVAANATERMEKTLDNEINRLLKGIGL